MKLVTSVKERCRVCYTCVRECPAKAIRISQGQAEVMPDRCIGCGNCVRVCSQNAKEVLSSSAEILGLLDSGARVAALVAPSFPVEFDEVDSSGFVGMLRRLGFSSVHEVAFGADIVAQEYRRLLVNNPHSRYIATTCPALVSYIEYYHPELIQYLAPVVSPMIAAARVLRKLHGDSLRLVFVGPCIAKKAEAADVVLPGDIDAVCTFAELREMFSFRAITAQPDEGTGFDPPTAATGRLFPLVRGLLQTAEIPEDLISGDVVAADGRTNFVEAIKEFENGTLQARLLEILCCQGCIMGAGITRDYPLFLRRSKVSQYVRSTLDGRHREPTLVELPNVDLSRRFTNRDQRIPAPSYEEITRILAGKGKLKKTDELNCGACGYETCREHEIAIYKGLAENEMCLPYMIDQLKKTIRELEESNTELASTQSALMQSEKLAGMGQLAAGIAHELNNPLGVVLMYAHLLLEEAATNPRLQEDVATIADQADRCKKIVSGLLNFARQNRIVRQPTDLRRLIERSIKSVGLHPSIEVTVRHDLAHPMAEIDRDQLTQVLVNLLTNAQAAMPDGGALSIETRGTEASIVIRVSDAGIGIPKENQGKIFDPFFTTKQIGKGTGLGLAVTYGIVKMHCGDIRVESNADPDQGPTGTTFTVVLPRLEKQITTTQARKDE